MVSVVIPVYNAEQYLDQCLISVVSQTFRDIDIVLIDDGSSDSSPQICDKWVKKDSRICVVHQKNGGVTAARKVGVQKACGEWICFVDADDEIPSDAIENLIKVAHNVDVVVGQIEFYGPYNWPYPRTDERYDRESFIKCLLHRQIHCGPVAKLYKKNLFDDFIFEIPSTVICGEDFIMNLRLADKVDAIRTVNTVVYFYYYRENSAMAKNPFVSARYSLFFNSLTYSSIHVTSTSLFISLMNNLMSRLLKCAKEKLKRCFRRLI